MPSVALFRSLETTKRLRHPGSYPISGIMCLAVPGKLVEMEGDEPTTRMGKVDFGGIQKEVSLAYVPDCALGDYLLIHVGFALQRLDEDEAQKILGAIREMGELEEFEQEVRETGQAAGSS